MFHKTTFCRFAYKKKKENMLYCLVCIDHFEKCKQCKAGPEELPV